MKVKAKFTTACGCSQTMTIEIPNDEMHSQYIYKLPMNRTDFKSIVDGSEHPKYMERLFRFTVYDAHTNEGFFEEIL